MTPEQLAALAKSVPKVVEQAYDDATSPALKQVGKIVEEVFKTVRLALFPLQYLAAWQDRLQGYLDRAVRQVPADRLIAPGESILLPIAEKLRFQEDGNPITDLYINLLARAMDGERVGEAHPAFLVIISQLAPDEILFLRELSRQENTAIVRTNQKWEPAIGGALDTAIDSLHLWVELRTKLRKVAFRYDKLNQPDLFRVFDEHLRHLGLTTYTNDPSDIGEFVGAPIHGPGFPRVQFLRLTEFGCLFQKACIGAET